MYKWRDFFKIFLDSEACSKYNETSFLLTERNSTQIKANMAYFMSNVEKSGILTQFKNNKSLYDFSHFVSANYHLLGILQFQPKLVSNDHIFITDSSLAQSICYFMQTSVLTMIDSYSGGPQTYPFTV